MCYSIYISTDSPENLGEGSFEHLQFQSDLEPEPGHEVLLTLLAYPKRWYLNRKVYGGCSCHFRHAMEEPLFEPPQEWSPEDAGDVAATMEAYRLFRRLVREGYQVDLINAWSGDAPIDRIARFEVHLESVPEQSFRFFEGYKFEFKA